MLARVVPLRDFFLVPANYSSSRSQLVQRFGELMRKIWNPRNFKGQGRPAAVSQRMGQGSILVGEVFYFIAIKSVGAALGADSIAE